MNKADNRTTDEDILMKNVASTIRYHVRRVNRSLDKPEEQWEDWEGVVALASIVARDYTMVEENLLPDLNAIIGISIGLGIPTEDAVIAACSPREAKRRAAILLGLPRRGDGTDHDQIVGYETLADV